MLGTSLLSAGAYRVVGPPSDNHIIRRMLRMLDASKTR